MKNKRLVHGKIIANFQEKSQQAEVVRHDMKGSLEVSEFAKFLGIQWIH